MNRVLAVIGFGNELRGDDAIGIAVVNSVREILERNDDPRLRRGALTIAAAPTLDVGWTEELADCSAIILVDAWESEQGASDSERQLLVQEVQTAAIVPSLTSHVSSPETLASLIEALYGRRPEITLVAVPGENFELREGISPRGEAFVGLAVDAVVALINSIIPVDSDQR